MNRPTSCSSSSGLRMWSSLPLARRRRPNAVRLIDESARDRSEPALRIEISCATQRDAHCKDDHGNRRPIAAPPVLNNSWNSGEYVGSARVKADIFGR